MEDEHAALPAGGEERAAPGIQVRGVRRGADVRASEQETEPSRERTTGRSEAGMRNRVLVSIGGLGVLTLVWVVSAHVRRLPPERPPERREVHRATHGVGRPRSAGAVEQPDVHTARAATRGRAGRQGDADGRRGGEPRRGNIANGDRRPPRATPGRTTRSGSIAGRG